MMNPRASAFDQAKPLLSDILKPTLGQLPVSGSQEKVLHPLQLVNIGDGFFTRKASIGKIKHEHFVNLLDGFKVIVNVV